MIAVTRLRSGIARTLMIISLCALCILAIPSLQASSGEKPNLAQQRALYKQAKVQLQAGQINKFYASKARLTGYPLYPYLERLDLEYQMAQIKQHHINLYTERYADLPTARQLQFGWLKFLAKQRRWKDYLKAYQQAGINHEKYACYQKKALLRTGQTKQALENIASFWNVGHSITDICDPVFHVWISKQGGPSSEQASQRFWKAVASNNIKLATYLKRFITDKQQKKSADLFLQVRDNPALLKKPATLKGDTLATRQTYLYGLATLSRKSPQTATRIWLKIRSSLNFTTEQRQKLNRRLASRLINNPDKQTDPLLASLNQQLDSEIQERRVKLALTKLDWRKVYTLIDALSVEEQQEESWVYWKTVAASHTRDLKPAYSDAFITLSRERSYYGLLAAGVLQSQFHLNPLQSKPDPAITFQLQNTDAFARMHELYLNNELYLARREWNHALANSDNETLYAASAIVHTWDWNAQTIRGVAKSKYWDAIALRFPMPYSPLFAEKAKQFKIDTNWARAVARQESAFQATARSHVGARGLMQLMPKTAQDTARKNKVEYRRESQLYSPATNITLGTAYLAEMKKKFKGNQVYATAAYNAGPRRVSRWLKARGELPIDIWIETIPFSETRKYVKNVVAYHAVYGALAGKPSHIVQSQTAFNLAMKESSGAKQSKPLRDFINASGTLPTP
ncbi:MAG: transglycosylase SLT domain-containing protein [Amphritea sp.]